MNNIIVLLRFYLLSGLSVFFDDFVHKTFAQFILQAKIEKLLVALCDGRPCIGSFKIK